MVAFAAAVTDTVMVHPPAGIRPPVVKVTVLCPAVAVITFVTVADATQAPVVRPGVAAMVTPAGNKSIKAAVSQIGAVLLLPKVIVSVDVVPPSELYVGLNVLVTLGLAGGGVVQLPMSLTVLAEVSTTVMAPVAVLMVKLVVPEVAPPPYRVFVTGSNAKPAILDAPMPAIVTLAPTLAVASVSG